MTFRYGFELECFWKVENKIVLPPKSFPTDGFPGLIEIRTYGHHSLAEAFGKLEETILQLDGPVDSCLAFDHVHTYPAAEKRELRQRNWSTKRGDIKNLYNKKPRALGNKTIASFQINISNLLSHSRTEFVGTDRVSIFRDDVFAPLDIPSLVRKLDEEFSVEITQSGRQPGEYCIKDNRLEYRSLPNSVWTKWTRKALYEKIKRAVEKE